VSAPSTLFPRGATLAHRLIDTVRARGEQTAFYGRALFATPDAVRRYPGELLRVISQMGLGMGALAIIGGTVVVTGFLTISTGSLVAVQGYATLSDVGVEAMTGFLSAFFNVRMIAPSTAGVAISATIGAGATAQLGAMRINEEIDALEAMGIRSITYLVSTRIIAGVAVVIPLYCIAVIMTFVAARFLTVSLYGQSRGVYDHYFSTFLRPSDLFWSFVATMTMAATAMVIHTYYGFTASGGPAGVGEAVGRSVRASMVALAFLVCTFMLAVYGQSGNFHLSG
jgi:phospholipid/cholesterol/gamma-HCH transport system permease protein